MAFDRESRQRVLSYDQTSSGRAYTIQGTDKNLGVVPPAVSDIFATIAEHTKREFLVRMSYMEVCCGTGLILYQRTSLTALVFPFFFIRRPLGHLGMEGRVAILQLIEL